jgi:hypothetical protein
MGVQHRDGARGALQLGVIATKGMHRLPTALDHQGIELALMLPCQITKFCRQGEGQQEIVAGHLFLELTFQPLLTLVVLTVGAVPMATGVRHENLFVTLVALRQHLWAERGATGLHGGERAGVPRQDRILVLRQKLGLEGFDDR